jgi:hypothetical protein
VGRRDLNDEREDPMLRLLKTLSSVAAAALLMVAVASAETVAEDMRISSMPEPVTMVLLGTGLLAAFKVRRHHA